MGHFDVPGVAAGVDVKATLPLEGVEQPVHVLFIVENNPVPGDRRVWPEVLAARELGHHVSVICPKDSNGVPVLI